MKAFFLGRRMREKLLLLMFAALGLLIWAGQLLGRAQLRWDDWRSTRAELAAQQVWLSNGPAIDAKAAAATKSLEPARTLNAARLVGELNTIAVQFGLSAEINSQRTEHTSQFDFHSVQVSFRRVELKPLLNFYEELSKRAPYIGLEQFTLVNDKATPGLLTVSFRIGSTELTH